MAVAPRQIPGSKHTPDQEVTGGDIMCMALIREGVQIMFGYPGGAIMPFYDALYGWPELRHILVRHEQAGVHAADAYARATGQVGVCIGTSGPGATNLVTGLANAFLDSVPLVAITGQVARPAMGKDSFQETDVLGVTIPVTKHNILVRSAEDLGPAIHEAFAIARVGRPGPVLIDVPKDVQIECATYDGHPWAEPTPFPGDTKHDAHIQAAARLLDVAHKPLILAGHGVILSRGYDALREFAEKTGIPVVTTLLGISAFPESHPLALGMPGMHGAASVNRAIDEADVIIAVGMRFDDRVTGKVSNFAPNARIIHIDIEDAELEKVVRTEVPIRGDAREVLGRLIHAVSPNEHVDWLNQIRKSEPPTPTTFGDLPHPMDILQGIKRASGGEAILTTDVGQNQMWSAQFYGYDRPNSHFTSGGLGTMGFALPAAIGVKLGLPEAQVWAVAGDGGFQMTLQELATIADHNLDIKVVIMNNGYLGMVRQWQKFFHGGRYSATPISSPDFVRLAEAYGLRGRRVTHRDELQDALDWAAQTPGCVILDVAIEEECNVYPMIPSGASVMEMIEEPVEHYD